MGRAVTLRLRAADPDHLIASPGWPSRHRGSTASGAAVQNPTRPLGRTTRHAGRDSSATTRYRPFDLLGRDGQAGFDLVAINAYTGASRFPEPWFSDGLNTIQTNRACRW